MEKVFYDNIKETLYFKKLDNGLDVYLIPKKGFNKNYATFTTKYGSIDNKFIPIGKEEMITVPDGIAHFLEHKLFESEKGDVSIEFSKQGANSNAFTSFSRTTYLFSCTEELNKNLETLIDFVQEPYFTEESVQKEKGIIDQEIRMYQDNPDWRIYFGLIQNMYKNHPIRIDIAGTSESIDKITYEMLYTCYETFYHPSNMLLLVVGDFDVEEIMSLIEKNQQNKTFKEAKDIKRHYELEDNQVFKKEASLKMDVLTPKVLVGIKDNLKIKRTPSEQLIYEISLSILLDIFIGRSSDNYERLLKEEIINENFSLETTFDETYGFILLGGDTKKPDVLEKELYKILLNIKDLKIDEDDFKNKKSKIIGGYLGAFNSPEFIANQFTSYKFKDMNLFDILEISENITINDLENVKDIFTEKAISSFKILKKD